MSRGLVRGCAPLDRLVVMQWLRLYSEARTDNKLRTLTDAQHRVWFNLLCFAGEQATRGEIQERDQFMLAIECASGDEGLLVETLGILLRLRIIEYQEDGSFRFSAWESRQYDKPSDRPEATAERKRRSREKAESHAPPSNKDDVSRDVTPGHALYTDTDTDTDTEQSRAEGESERDSGANAPPKPKVKRASQMTDDWQPATELYVWAANEVDMPASEVNRETFKFRDHFKATGKPMKDWDAAWKNWMRRSREFGPARASPNGHSPPLELSPERIAEHQRRARELGYQGEVRELT